MTFRLRVEKDWRFSWGGTTKGKRKTSQQLVLSTIERFLSWKLFSPCHLWGSFPKAPTRPKACHVEMNLKKRQILKHHLNGSNTDPSCGTAKSLLVCQIKEYTDGRVFLWDLFFLVQSWRSLAKGNLSPTFVNKIMVGERQPIEFKLGLEYWRERVDCRREKERKILP